MTPTHRVTVRHSATELLLTDIAPAHAEWAHRCHEGQRAILWQWLPSRDGVEEPCWEVMFTERDYDDMRGETFTRFVEEHDDDHARDVAVGR